MMVMVVILAEQGDSMLGWKSSLVDGSFVMAKKSLELKFRGSWNQRIIDVQKSLVEGHVVIHQIQLDEMAEHPDREYNTSSLGRWTVRFEPWVVSDE